MKRILHNLRKQSELLYSEDLGESLINFISIPWFHINLNFILAPQRSYKYALFSLTFQLDMFLHHGHSFENFAQRSVHSGSVVQSSTQTHKIWTFFVFYHTTSLFFSCLTSSIQIYGIHMFINIQRSLSYLFTISFT